MQKRYNRTTSEVERLAESALHECAPRCCSPRVRLARGEEGEGGAPAGRNRPACSGSCAPRRTPRRCVWQAAGPSGPRVGGEGRGILAWICRSEGRGGANWRGHARSDRQAKGQVAAGLAGAPHALQAVAIHVTGVDGRTAGHSCEGDRVSAAAREGVEHAERRFACTGVMRGASSSGKHVPTHAALRPLARPAKPHVHPVSRRQP